MARKRYKPEEIVAKLRQADVLHGQGMARIDAIREITPPHQRVSPNRAGVEAWGWTSVSCY
jgi:hypothetical protein